MKTIFVAEHTNNYTCIVNSTLQDIQLSWAATGLLVYMLSMPEDWVINITDLAKRKKTTKYEIYKLMKELINHGYVIRNMDRSSGKIIKSVYLIYEKSWSKIFPINEADAYYKTTVNS